VRNDANFRDGIITMSDSKAGGFMLKGFFIAVAAVVLVSIGFVATTRGLSGHMIGERRGTS
jgi:hypothetical protein